MAALMRIAKWPQLQLPRERLRRSALRSGRPSGVHRAAQRVSIAAAAVKLRRRRRKIAHRGFEGRLARVLSGRQPLHGSRPGRGGGGEEALMLSRGLLAKDEGVILGHQYYAQIEIRCSFWVVVRLGLGLKLEP